MDIAATFIQRSRYYLATEYPTKIRRCLDARPEGALWRRSDPDSNSIGNLLLHLRGNVEQWIVSSVGGMPDQRHRRGEFDAREGASANSLFGALVQTIQEADVVIAGLTPERLGERRTIQGREMTVMEAVFHVVEHFALHTGQIILLTKAVVPGRISFYEDAGGLAVPRWGDAP